jgi:CDP-2,3-bis-(O-geranylgeranyl)-sn-glycerol synthase
METTQEKKKFKLFGTPRPLDEEEKRYAKIAYAFAIGCLLGVLAHYFYFTIVYSYDDWLCILIYAFIFIAPGYLANAGMLIWGGKGPQMDFGYVCKDGRRLFGEGKTWRGFILGSVLFGIPIAMLIHGILFVYWQDVVDASYAFFADPKINYTFYETPEELIEDLRIYMLGSKIAEPDFQSFLRLMPRIILCSFGAGVGDLIGSWAKRRKGLARGAPFWVIDQIDFIGGCLLLTVPLVIGNFHIQTFIFLLIFTPSLTVLANTISYLTGHKKVPW